MVTEKLKFGAGDPGAGRAGRADALIAAAPATGFPDTDGPSISGAPEEMAARKALFGPNGDAHRARLHRVHPGPQPRRPMGIS